MLADAVGSTGNGGGGGAAEDYILIRDEKANNSGGGTFTSGVWQTRDLNTEVVDTGDHASLASNQITLNAGTYRVKARCPAWRVSKHKCKLYNVSDSVDLIIGSSIDANSVNLVSSHTFLEGRFVLSGTKIIELQHRCLLTVTGDGFGIRTGLGVIEVFAVIEFWKEA